MRVSDVAQQFTQGNIDFTDNNLDLALSGPGFFTAERRRRAGLHARRRVPGRRDGYVVNAQQQRLQVYPPIAGGGFNTGALATCAW